MANEVESARQQLASARQVLQQKRQQAEQVEKQLQEQERRLPDVQSERALRSQGIQQREQRRQAIKAGEYVEQKKKEIQEAKSKISEYESRFGPAEKQISEYEERKKDVEQARRISLGLESPVGARQGALELYKDFQRSSKINREAAIKKAIEDIEFQSKMSLTPEVKADIEKQIRFGSSDILKQSILPGTVIIPSSQDVIKYNTPNVRDILQPSFSKQSLSLPLMSYQPTISPSTKEDNLRTKIGRMVQKPEEYISKGISKLSSYLTDKGFRVQVATAPAIGFGDPSFVRLAFRPQNLNNNLFQQYPTQPANRNIITTQTQTTISPQSTIFNFNENRFKTLSPEYSEAAIKGGLEVGSFVLPYAGEARSITFVAGTVGKMMEEGKGGVSRGEAIASGLLLAGGAFRLAERTLPETISFTKPLFVKKAEQFYERVKPLPTTTYGYLGAPEITTIKYIRSLKSSEWGLLGKPKPSLWTAKITDYPVSSLNLPSVPARVRPILKSTEYGFLGKPTKSFFNIKITDYPVSSLNLPRTAPRVTPYISRSEYGLLGKRLLTPTEKAVSKLYGPTYTRDYGFLGEPRVLPKPTQWGLIGKPTKSIFSARITDYPVSSLNLPPIPPRVKLILRDSEYGFLGPNPFIQGLKRKYYESILKSRREVGMFNIPQIQKARNIIGPSSPSFLSKGWYGLGRAVKKYVGLVEEEALRRKSVDLFVKSGSLNAPVLDIKVSPVIEKTKIIKPKAAKEIVDTFIPTPTSKGSQQLLLEQPKLKSVWEGTGLYETTQEYSPIIKYTQISPALLQLDISKPSMVRNKQITDFPRPSAKRVKLEYNFIEKYVGKQQKGYLELLKYKEKSITQQKPKQDLIQRLITFGKAKSKQSSIPRQLISTKFRTEQLSKSKYKQKTIQKKKTKIPLYYLPITPPKKIATISKRGIEDIFEVFIRRKGEDTRIGTSKTEKQAANLLFGKLKGTLAASGFVTRKGFGRINLSDFFGSEFRPSKREPKRVVQRRGFRLGTQQERKEIQWFGSTKGGKNKRTGKFRWWD